MYSDYVYLPDGDPWLRSSGIMGKFTTGSGVNATTVSNRCKQNAGIRHISIGGTRNSATYLGSRNIVVEYRLR